MRRTTFSARHKFALGLLVGLLFVAAMYLGGAAPAAIPVCATLALCALAATGLDVASARRDPLVWAAAVLLGVSVLQLVPLPPGLLRAFDPHSAEISAGALSPFRIDRTGDWRPLHLDPGNGWSYVQ